MGAAVLAGTFGGYNLDAAPHAPPRWDDEGDYETSQEARDRAYRNQLARASSRSAAVSAGPAKDANDEFD